MILHPNRKTAEEITAEWDALAPIRLTQILSGEDISYREILTPNVLELIQQWGRRVDTIVDAGCGVGVLTSRLAKVARRVIGVDPSSVSIQLASRNFGSSANFVVASFEDYASTHVGEADVVVANMVLMDTLRLDEFLFAARRTLRVPGALVFSITHPCFWPIYHGYSSKPWFRYTREQLIESPFQISTERSCPLHSTHIHRPLTHYVEQLSRHGFQIQTLREPMPSEEISKLYPEVWEFPRYLFALCCRP